MSLRAIVRVEAALFDAARESARLTEGRTDIGALVTFTGLCRDDGGTLSALEIEHYPGMAEAEIARVANEALGRWPLQGLLVLHRFGRIAPGEPIVLVAAASQHRHEAFAAASFLMDFMKTEAPFWKKQRLTGGDDAGWVAAKDEDEAAAGKWRSSLAPPFSPCGTAAAR